MSGLRSPLMLRLAFAALLLGLAACTSTVTRTEVKGDGKVEAPPTDERSAKKLAGIRLELASLYFTRGQFNTALTETKKAIEGYPNYSQAYDLSGLIYASLGNPSQAEASFQRALQIEPGNADAMQNYGWFLCQNQRYKEADAQFQQALVQPNYRGAATTLRAMGNCQARDGRLADAEASLMRSYQLDPGSAATAFNLAGVQYRRGEYERARFYIDRVNKSTQQSNAQTLWLAARIEQKLGNQAMAQTLGRELLERYPKSAEALAFEQARYDE
jgi:type IV pilus assembly protein PilF